MQPINRAIHHRTEETGGVKLGNFGTGGRTYVSEVREQRHEGANCTKKFWGGLSLLGGAILLFIAESGLRTAYADLNEAQAATTYYPQSSGLVHLTADPLPFDHLTDEYFGRNFPSAVLAQRQTEYCQWQEIRNVERILKGKEPDRCAQAGGQCSISCQSLSLSSCNSKQDDDGNDCCRVVPGADIFEERISFEYLKGWHSAIIPSLLFDNAISYHNPTRDPAPSRSFISQQDVRLNTQHGMALASGNLLLPGAEPPLLAYLDASNANKVSSGAVLDGFLEFDQRYFYSRVAYDGAESQFAAIAKGTASYLLEGVVDASLLSKEIGLDSVLARVGLDWITKGSCNAGDIRVRHTARKLPSKITIIANANQGHLSAYNFPSGHKALVRAGSLTLEQFLEADASDARWMANMNRVHSVILFAIGAFLIMTDKPEGKKLE